METISKLLKTYSKDLLFISESEFPFETVFYENERVFTGFINLLGKNKIETEGVDYFFRNMIKVQPEYSNEELETIQKYGLLIDFIKENLKNTKVYRCGEIHVKAYIVGETIEGHFAGLSTTLFET